MKKWWFAKFTQIQLPNQLHSSSVNMVCHFLILLFLYEALATCFKTNTFKKRSRPEVRCMHVTMPESLVVFHFKGDGFSPTPSICNWSSWRRTGMERKYRWKQQRSLLNGFFCHYNMVSYKLQTGTCTLLEGTCRRVISLRVVLFTVNSIMLVPFVLFCIQCWKPGDLHHQHLHPLPHHLHLLRSDCADIQVFKAKTSSGFQNHHL